MPAMLLLASLALMVIFAYAPDGPPQPRASMLAAVALTDDDGGQALFSSSLLVPGATATGCLEVHYDGAAGAGAVHLAATDVSGPLNPYLRVRVERGTGGAFGDCVGFTGGTEIFDGALADLVDADPAVPEHPTGWAPADGQARTFRISVSVLDEPLAQGKTGAATFRWMLVPIPADPSPTTVPPTVAPTPEPPVQPPTVAPTSEPPAQSPSPRPPAQYPESGSDVSSAQPAPPGRPPVPVRSAAPESPPGATIPAPRPGRLRSAGAAPGVVATVREAIAELAEKAGEVAMRTAEDGALPAGGLGVLAAFLALQNHIDRRDPKLLFAPITEPHLDFQPPEPDDEAETT